jgi:hypothetical protein
MKDYSPASLALMTKSMRIDISVVAHPHDAAQSSPHVANDGDDFC